MEDELTDGDLDEFMEVVMTYKCKFCEFTSTSARQIASHVKDLHQRKKKVIGNASFIVQHVEDKRPLTLYALPRSYCNFLDQCENI